MGHEMTDFCSRVRRRLPAAGNPRNNTTRSLQVQYATALGLVVCLTILNQLLLTQSLALKRCENAVIDALGKERLSAWRLITAAQAVQEAAEDAAPGEPAGPVSEAVARWSRSHQALQSLRDRAAVPMDVARGIRHAEPEYRATVDAAGALIEHVRSRPFQPPDRAELRGLVAQSVARTKQYVQGLDRVTSQWNTHAAGRERRLARSGLLLVSMTVLVLLVQAFWVFRRAIRQMSGLFDRQSALARNAQEARAIADRMATRMRKTEAEFQNLALIAMETDNLVMITDVAHRIQWVNGSFTRVTGYAAEEAIGRTPDLLLSPDGEGSADAPWAQAIRQSDGSESEIAIRSKSGGTRWLMVDCQVADHEADGSGNFILIATDVTDLKRTSEE
jgi:PAS domain S-box-containing protein